jgi:hypothetical protein
MGKRKQGEREEEVDGARLRAEKFLRRFEELIEQLGPVKFRRRHLADCRQEEHHHCHPSHPALETQGHLAPEAHVRCVSTENTFCTHMCVAGAYVRCVSRGEMFSSSSLVPTI